MATAPLTNPTETALPSGSAEAVLSAVIRAWESTLTVVVPSTKARVAPPTDASLIIAETAKPSAAPSPKVFARAVWVLSASTNRSPLAVSVALRANASTTESRLVVAWPPAPAALARASVTATMLASAPTS